MALDKPALKEGIKQAFTSALGVPPTGEQAQAFDEVAGNLADAIDIFVKSATVVHVLTSPSGPVTGTITIE